MKPDEDRPTKHERQTAFRGRGTDVCANEDTNTPEFCGSEQPVVDAEGRPLHQHQHEVPRSAPKK